MGEDDPGRGHLCHTDTFLVRSINGFFSSFRTSMVKSLRNKDSVIFIGTLRNRKNLIDYEDTCRTQQNTQKMQMY